MIVLHAGLTADGLLLWGERPVEKAAPPTKRPGRKPRLPWPQSHPFGATADDLQSALATVPGVLRQVREGVPGAGRGVEAFVAWLPTSAGAPAASGPLIAQPPETDAAVSLAPWTVTTLPMSVGASVDLLCAAAGRETLAPGVVVGRDLAFAAAALREAGARVARQQYPPAIERADGAWRALWRPVVAGPDAQRLAKLVRAMPDACRALQRKADAPPRTAALPLLMGFIASVVVPGSRFERREEFAERCRFRTSSFVVLYERPKGPAQIRRPTMRVMVFAKATEDSEKGVAPTPEAMEAFAAMDRFTEELIKAGVFVAAAGLKPSAQSKRIAFDGASRTVIDGPFAEARELIAGFSIWEVKDMDEAVAWAKRCPNPMSGPSEIEIRPFYEAADLAEFVTPEELATPREGTRGKLGVA